MTTLTWERLSAASGLASFVVGVAAIGVSSRAGVSGVDPGAAPAAVAAAYAAATPVLVWVGAWLQVVAYLLLLVFIARLWAPLSQAEGESAWLAGAAVGAGRGAVTLTLVGFILGGVARYRAGPGLDQSALLALIDAHVALYIASWALGAVFFGATAALVLRRPALAPWLGWGAAACAVIDLAATALPTTALAQFPSLLLWLWVLAASVALVRRPGGTLARRAAPEPLNGLPG